VEVNQTVQPRQEVFVLTRIGFGLLDIGLLVGLLLPTVAVTFVVGRHLHSGGMIAAFALLLATIAVIVFAMVRAVRAAGWT
jgi:hypothetical protein